MANSTRASRVVSISLPRATGDALDRLARARALSRSAVLREALREYQKFLREREELERVLRIGARYGRRFRTLSEAQVERLIHRPGKQRLLPSGYARRTRR